MWIFLKKQGILFDPDRDEMTIDSVQGPILDIYILQISLNNEGDVTTVTFDREKLDMFITQFEDALKHKEHVFTFDEDKPKYRMRLSGRSDDHEPDPIQMDVGLE